MVAERTSSSIQSASTSLAFEVLGFLMQSENLEIVKVTLTVIAPRSSQDLIQGGTTTLLLSHCECQLKKTHASTEKEVLVMEWRGIELGGRQASLKPEMMQTPLKRRRSAQRHT